MKELRTHSDLEEAIEQSASKPVFIFKHSTACPVSSSAYQRVGQYIEENGEEDAPWYLVKVIESRPVSNEIAETFGVRHQSPQLLLVKDKNAVWNTSHSNITPTAIEKALDQAS